MIYACPLSGCPETSDTPGVCPVHAGVLLQMVEGTESLTEEDRLDEREQDA